MTTAEEQHRADPRYLQVARELRQDIVDGVYPVGSQLPTEHELCERFSVSRYTIREALRRLRDDQRLVDLAEALAFARVYLARGAGLAKSLDESEV